MILLPKVWMLRRRKIWAKIIDLSISLCFLIRLEEKLVKLLQMIMSLFFI